MRAILAASFAFLFGYHPNATPTDSTHKNVRIVPKEDLEMPPTRVPPESWSEAGKDGSTTGGLTLEVVKVSVSTQPDKHYLEVIWLAHTDGTQRHTHIGWSSSQVRLVDSFKNDYPLKRVDYDRSIPGFVDYPTGEFVRRLAKDRKLKFAALTDGVVSADQAKWGTLYFDLPLKSATVLHLSLDAEAFGLNGTFRFRVPREMYAK